MKGYHTRALYGGGLAREVARLQIVVGCVLALFRLFWLGCGIGSRIGWVVYREAA